MPRSKTLLRLVFAPAIGRGRRFSSDERGATLIEFAILAVPFFTLIFAILETTLVFFSGQILDSAVQDATRLVRTGQAQAARYTLETMRTAVCDSLFGMFDCSKVRLRVSVVSDFASANSSDSPIQTGAECRPTCEWKLAEGFTPGSGSSVVMVEAYYKWPVLMNVPGFNLANQSDGTRLLGSVRVFQNEPF